MDKLFNRRELLAGTAAATILGACARSPIHHLGKALTSDWNEAFEKLIFSKDRLAKELPRSEETPENEFPFFFQSHSLPMPPVDWTLKVGGLVERPAIFTLNDLLRMPPTDMCVRHYCVDGWTAVASWRGVRVCEIARLVGIDRTCRFVEFRSFDAGYWSGWDLASALHPQTLLAYEMNRHPLGPERGAPLRLYSAIKLGYKSVKYLSEVNFLPTKVGGTREDRGDDWFAGI